MYNVWIIIDWYNWELDDDDEIFLFFIIFILLLIDKINETGDDDAYDHL